MKLSKRLDAIYNLINRDEIVSDIGCDHAYLCCSLILNKGCTKAYACDINIGPLNQAKENIEYYKLSDKIETILCNGLEIVNEDVTTIVIAGMGFETIQSILEANLDKLNNRKCIIQSNKDVEGLRCWISDHNFKIIEEKVILDTNQYYQIIVFNTLKDEPLNDDELVFGKKMVKDFDYYSLWKSRLSTYEKILRGLYSESDTYKEIFNKMLQIYKELGS